MYPAVSFNDICNCDIYPSITFKNTCNWNIRYILLGHLMIFETITSNWHYFIFFQYTEALVNGVFGVHAASLADRASNYVVGTATVQRLVMAAEDATDYIQSIESVAGHLVKVIIIIIFIFIVFSDSSLLCIRR